jgi:hypothetical protein
MSKARFQDRATVAVTDNIDHNVIIDLQDLQFDITTDNRLLITLPVQTAGVNFNALHDFMAQFDVENGGSLTPRDRDDVSDDVWALINNKIALALLRNRITWRRR